MTRRRGLLAGAAAVVVAAVVITGLGLYTQGPQPASAATPYPLSYQEPSGSPAADAAKRLQTIAARAARRPSTAVPAGEVEHVKTTSWQLNSAVKDGRTTSAVVPEQREIWRAADGRGRVVTQELAPIFDSARASREWQDRFGRPAPGKADTGDYAPGTLPLVFGAAGRPPADPDAFDAWVRDRAGLRDGADAADVMAHAATLAAERVFTPAELSALLRMVAGFPGLAYYGTVVDRAGRTGEAYSLSSEASGLYTVHTLIVDAGTGRLLGYEETLTRSAGALNVRIPAVITYRVYLDSDYQPAPW